MERKLQSQHHDKQEVAYVLSSHITRAKSDKKTASLFSKSEEASSDRSRRRTYKQTRAYLRQQRSEVKLFDTELSGSERAAVDAIRSSLAEKDKIYLQEKKGSFSAKERGKLLFEAKVSPLSGLGKAEKLQMYREAGYTDDEISGITGKKLLFSAGISTPLSLTSQFGRINSAVHEDIVPFIGNIPEADMKTAAVASVLTYIGSFALLTEQNLRLTKKYGASANTTVTGLYLLGDRLLPNSLRDWASRGLPLSYDTAVNAFGFAAVAQGLTGDSKSVVAGALTAAAFNVTIATGAQGWMRWKRGKVKIESEKVQE